MKIPSLEEAQRLLAEAEILNPGPWIAHSIYVAEAAKYIANLHPDLDGDVAYILGYLHDIGRREGVTDLRHILDGYTFLQDLGYTNSAKVCMTHSFPTQSPEDGAGRWDCTAEERNFIHDYITHVEFDEYDLLLQLCDALALPSGFTLIEKRLIDVGIRRGVNDLTPPRWKAFLELEKHFSGQIGRSIYSVLPNVVENTFGF